MTSRRAHLALHLTVLWPVLLGALGVLLYGVVYGGPAPSLGGERPTTEGCLGDRIAVEAWPAPSARAPFGTTVSPGLPSPLAGDP